MRAILDRLRIGASGTRKARAAAEGLYTGLVEQSRNPALYTEFDVPDTLDGRIDLLAVHLFLVLDRLERIEGSGHVGQELVDTMIADLDRNLREMGVGDLGVGKRVQAMAKAIYGRLEAYQIAVGREDALEAVSEALQRNVYRRDGKPDDAVTGLARYVLRQRSHLDDIGGDAMLSGKVSFADAVE